jgi:hypothetical protein
MTKAQLIKLFQKWRRMGYGTSWHVFKDVIEAMKG